MSDFIIKKLPYDLSSYAGQEFIGMYLKRIKLNFLVDSAFPVRADAFFMRALGLHGVPSRPTLRQRSDVNASSWFDLAVHMNQLLRAAASMASPLTSVRWPVA